MTQGLKIINAFQKFDISKLSNCGQYSPLSLHLKLTYNDGNEVQMSKNGNNKITVTRSKTSGNEALKSVNLTLTIPPDDDDAAFLLQEFMAHNIVQYHVYKVNYDLIFCNARVIEIESVFI